MARPFEELVIDDEAITDRQQSARRLDRSAARAFAAAISSLIIATLVISNSAGALDAEGTVAGNSFEVGTISLVDDDQGRSLVNLTDMAPGRPSESCIAVTYEGSILPVDISLGATTTGELANYLVVAIEWGQGAGYESCEGFERGGSVYAGTMAALAGGDPITVATLRNQGDDISFRFRFELLDDDRAVGLASSVDFVWEALPS
ncbi:MAG: hypothetical protein GY713_16805 [Actinomycetia bacterium]|nr:hypothetical protein [Actinomycetes bacterium]